MQILLHEWTVSRVMLQHNLYRLTDSHWSCERPGMSQVTVDGRDFRPSEGSTESIRFTGHQEASQKMEKCHKPSKKIFDY